VELAARADAELGEHLAQVVLDRARADEQPGADFRVGQPIQGQPRDLGLLGGQLYGALDGALAGGLAGGGQLAPGPLGKRADARSPSLEPQRLTPSEAVVAPIRLDGVGVRAVQ
jgi:hypothetical protein